VAVLLGDDEPKPSCQLTAAVKVSEKKSVSLVVGQLVRHKVQFDRGNKTKVHLSVKVQFKLVSMFI
jgi:hypothetical protein